MHHVKFDYPGSSAPFSTSFRTSSISKISKTFICKLLRSGLVVPSSADFSPRSFLTMILGCFFRIPELQPQKRQADNHYVSVCRRHNCCPSLLYLALHLPLRYQLSRVIRPSYHHSSYDDRHTEETVATMQASADGGQGSRRFGCHAD